MSGREPAVAVDGSGRIIVATLAARGAIPGAEIRVIVRRLGPRGIPDPSFRARILRLGQGFEAGLALAIDPCGRIVVEVGFSPLSSSGAP